MNLIGEKSMQENFSFEKWHKKYKTNKIVDLKKYFSIEEFNYFRKLGIKIKDDIYTAFEFDNLYYYGLLPYYVPEDEELSEEEKKNCKELNGTGVSRETLNSLLKKCEEIMETENIYAM